MRLDKMVLALKSPAQQQAALDQLVAAQQDLASPLFHQWLTPEEFGAQFGAPGAELAQVTAWLTAHGFTVKRFLQAEEQLCFQERRARYSTRFTRRSTIIVSLEHLISPTARTHRFQRR